MPSRTIRNVKRNNVIRAGFEHVVRVAPLQIAPIRPPVVVSSIELRSVANLSPLVEVNFAGGRIIETFQYDESGETLDTSDGTFENLIGVLESREVHESEDDYSRVDFLAL